MNLKPIKVMLVDDQKMANFITRKLIEVTGFSTEVVDYTVPQEALLDLSNTNPDLIFLDLNMPEVNGWQFLEVLTEKQNQTQVVIVTSSTSIHDKEKAQKYAQVIDFLEKPLTKNTILSLKSKLDLAG
ncbi:MULTISPECIES: response regulator [Leeuwenhoekiella]|jgi:CheY-like chemotaxis protein|uniref:Two-component response regulator n=1 Tax=Leeuwenhoekiella blandensis (strain CECT 7118 / CCUG 51940 / KCTC 22103 / MED217) TaxID=398720 RepID=A3XKM4_LEEBM|nr:MULTISPECIES: response regulator [Leeuwenhoekiella]EAQ49900.1 two-component response regulator [Leeuwenhoekiella blandensis MED217]MAO42569.1 response regulator [Leeuwenhoekiella sp.]HBT10511.1 response regulator [Leeuwenhoekiella sp.]HCW64938.1 response regulator [Leeuwenhoekiella sp.]|tara:strand:- start:10541 stop:10924 length:384 start_codon:yes stop_codon:yes gene_type:complete